MMSAPSDSHRVLLTAGDVKKLEDEYARMTAEIADIEARRKEIESRRDEINDRLGKIRELMTALGLADRLTVAQSFGPSPRGDPASGDISDPSEVGESHRSPWIKEILNHLKSAPYESMTSAELREHVECGELANLLKVSDKGYYHAIGRLARQGIITKENNRLFTVAGLEKYKADGSPALPHGAVSQRKSPMADEIIAFIEVSGGSARAGEIVSHLLTVEPFAGPVRRNKSSAYNVLARLVDRGHLERLEGAVYKVPETNEASANAEATHYPLMGNKTGAD
ncbi:hypothetical protein GJ654_02700 [Rhodoblastus acidophilus]|uniref:Uncharacterized protein n=1 Tax=Rhodoblastus acidophilus TaxID=1074 RepID=A0A6N8DHT2_RHOAC|nr:hypothetical protein [Rhodoblastus acidophilus]MCW2272997.1 putative transcriptional regulator [Rhodoblastus acidophilus]MTV29899.1 hypothetical protein [Rhodoblastus acidophilus]